MLTTNLLQMKQPIFKSEYFVGREAILKYIFANINDEFFNSLAIVGELGTGKTSLLNMIQLRDVQEKYGMLPNIVLVRVDPLERVRNSVDFYKNIGVNLLDAIRSHPTIEETHDQRIAPMMDGFYDFDDDFKLSRVITDILKYLHDIQYKVVFILDDFDKTVNSTNIDYANFRFLRSLAVDRLNMNVMYIISARKNVEFLSEAANTSGFNNIFHSQIPFKPQFSQEDVEQYLKTYISDQAILKKIDIEQIIQLSGRIAELLRVTCKCIISNEQNNVQRTEEQLLEQLIDESSSYLKRIVDHLEKEIKIMLDQDNYYDFEASEAINILENLGMVEIINEKPYFTSLIVEKYIERITNKLFINEVAVSHEQTLEPNQAKPDHFSGLELLENLMVHFLNIPQYHQSNHEDLMTNVSMLHDKLNHLDDKFNNFSKIMLSVKRDFAALKTKYLHPDNESIEDYADKLKFYAKNLVQQEGIETFKKQYLQQLGNVWGQLNESTQEFLLIGEFLNRFFDTEEMDLAPISICYCRAFELEINEKLLPTLKRLVPDFRVNVHRREINLSSHKIEKMTIGQINYVLRTRVPRFNKRINEYFDQHNIDLNKFTQDIRLITNIRNDTAHADPIDKSILNKLKTYIIGKNNRQGTLKKIVLLNE